MRLRAAASFGLCAFAAIACGDNGARAMSDAADGSDAAVAVDAANDPDAADLDAAMSDARTVDASAADASTVDVPVADAPLPDAPAVDASPDAGGIRFDLDVVVDPHSVYIWVREMFPNPCQPEEHFPRPNDCQLYSDYHQCNGSTQTCFQRIAVERGGTELANANLTYDSIWWSAVGLYSPNDIFAGGDLELVIEGCGSNLRLPLSRSPAAPAPVLTDVIIGGGGLGGTLQPTGGTSTYAIDESAIFSLACHEPHDDTWRISDLLGGPRVDFLYLSSIVDRPAVTTPWGEARIWIETPIATSRQVAIYGGDQVRHDVGTASSNQLVATIAIDGGPPDTIASMQWGFRDTASGPRVYATTQGTDAIDYQAGATTDTLAITRPNGRYSGTFPHVTPSNDINLSLDGDNRVALAFGPVTLANESNPSLTVQVSLDLAWQHPILPRIAP